MVFLTLLDECLLTTECTQISPQAHVLFALGLYLIVQRGQRIPRDVLTALLWPSVPERSARRCLRRALWKLRSNGFPVNGENGPHLFLPKQSATTDVDTLTQHDAATLAQRAFDVLPWYEPHCSAQFRDWVDDLRNLTRIRVTQQLTTVLKHAQDQADWTGVLHLSDRILTLDATCTTAQEANTHARAMLHHTPITQLSTPHLSYRSGESTRSHQPTAYPTHVAETLHPWEYGRHRSAPFSPRNTPIIEREKDVDMLTHALQHATHGKGGGFYIWGDAGIGKSRLVAELHHMASTQGAVVPTVTLEEHDSQRPWAAFESLVAQLQNAPGAAGCDPSLTRYLQQFTLASTTQAQAPTRPTSAHAPTLGDRTQLAIFDLIDAIAEEQPVVLIIENTHWIDTCSQSVTTNMIAWAATRAVLIVCTSRTPPPETLFRTTRQALTVHHLSTLTPTGSTQLANHILQTRQHERDAEMITWCLSVAEGNPYLLEELIAHWIHTGERFSAPSSMTTLIETRIAQLSDTARTFLQASAILDDDTTYDRLQRMFDASRPQFFSAMEELGASGLLSSDPTGNTVASGVTQLRCRNDLIRAIALKTLSHQGREVLHTHAAIVMEQELSEPQCTPLRWRCANHWRSAGNAQRAAQLETTCVMALLDQGRVNEVIDACERILPHCATDQTRFDMLTQYACAAHSIRDHEKTLLALTALRSLKATLDPTSTTHDASELLAFDTMSHVDQNWTAIAETCERCLLAHDATLQHRVNAAIILCKLATGLGNATRIRYAYDAVTPFLDHADVSEISRSRLEAIYHALVGDATVATTAAERLLTIARETRRGLPLLSSLIYCARCFQWSGITDTATALFAEIATTATRTHAQPYAIEAVQHLLGLFLNCGNTAAAQTWADQLASFPPPTDHILKRQSILLQLRFALNRQDIPAAETLFATHKGEILNDPLLSSRATALSAYIRLGHLQQVETTSLVQTVHELTNACKQLRGIRSYDYEHFSLYLGLNYIGENEHAKSMLHAYLTQFRRDVTPPPLEMQTAVHHEQLTT
jgi:hypothetical protein